MSDWRTYDDIALRYDELWGCRFETVARHLWALMPAMPRAQVLDIGTGTGIVPRSLGARLSEISGATACDCSVAMLSAARARMPRLRLVAATVTNLPFPSATFDVGTANFVLSHLADPESGLAEAHRVLKSGGHFAMTSWAAKTDPYTETWNRVMAEAISKDRLQEGINQITPFEGYFGEAKNVKRALSNAGFCGVEVHSLTSEWSFSLDHFVADREIGASGRFARHTLGPEAWSRIVAQAREELGRRFGPQFSFQREFLIGLGRRQ